MISKSDTISSIMRLNPTASPGFLAEFANEELAQYLGRLRNVSRRDPTAGGSCVEPSKDSACIAETGHPLVTPPPA